MDLSNLDRGHRLRSRQDSANTCLPQSLLSVVPTCAVNCIQTFASSNYPGSTCSDISSLLYLCTQNNLSGLTIGEGSLQCVVSFCTGQDQTNSSVYNICDGIEGAIPRTAQTITATIIGPAPTASSTVATLPATVSVPTPSQQISTIVMPTNATPLVTTSPPIPSSISQSSPSGESSSTSMSSSPGGTSGAIVQSDQQSARSGLTPAQTTGIAIGGGATAVIFFGLVVLLFWMRKRRRDRNRSPRRSSALDPPPPPPPNYQSPRKKSSPTFWAVDSSSTMPNIPGAVYQQQPMDDKRRSFWRKSLKSEEIGIAVSPKARRESSPVSQSSQRSNSRLLASMPNQALWPAPLDVEATRERRRFTPRPLSDATEFDDELENRTREPEQIIVDDQPFILEKVPPARRQRMAPPPLSLPAVPEDRPSTSSQTARIPLTPTYDNGNISFISPPRTIRSPPPVGQGGGQPPVPIPEHRLAPSSTYANRNVLRRKAPPRIPHRPVISPPIEPFLQPRDPPPTPPPAVSEAPLFVRPNSITSIYTEIEEDPSPPEETNKQLGLRANPPTPSNFPADVRRAFTGEASPIKDLKYPQIPRSAAISRNAENPAHRRGSPNLAPASGARPTRKQLVRAELSFMHTETTSSDGYMSDETIEWPVPPLSESGSAWGMGVPQTTLKSSTTDLRENAAGEIRRSPPPHFRRSLNEVLSLEPESMKVVEPQRSPSTKARLTPSKSSSGDLYLTVEI